MSTTTNHDGSARRTARLADYIGEVAEAHAAHPGLGRREMVKKLGVGLAAAPALGAILVACSSDDDPKEVATEASGPASTGLRMLGSNGGLVVTWYAQGQRTMQYWADMMGIELEWVDGELNAQTQRSRLETAVSGGKFDLAAITAHESGTVVKPIQQLIDSGTDVIQMISTIGEPGQELDLLTWCEQSSYDMGFGVATKLFEAAGGSGTVIQTQGPAAFTGAQERDRGFKDALVNFPDIELVEDDFGNWDVNRARTLWESYLNKHADITCGYFHNDDMALAALEAITAAGREGNVLIGGADAMPEAIKAVSDGRMTATARHSACRMHAYPVLIGAAKRAGSITEVPEKIVIDGPLVTADNAATLLLLQGDGLLLA